MPTGRVIFGELNYETDEYRILHAHGEGLEGLGAGVCLPLRESFCLHMANDGAPALIGRSSKDPVYGKLELHKSHGVQSYAAAPVELSNGTRVGTVSAMSESERRVAEAHAMAERMRNEFELEREGYAATERELRAKLEQTERLVEAYDSARRRAAKLARRAEELSSVLEEAALGDPGPDEDDDASPAEKDDSSGGQDASPSEEKGYTTPWEQW